MAGEGNPTLHMPEWEFQRLYGRWSPLLPAEVARLMTGAAFDWWVVGGWSLEADARSPRRPHEDVDVTVAIPDLDAVREHLRELHLWQAGPPGLRPLLPGEPLREGCEQLWVRRDAYSPWVLDLLLTPVDGPDWVFKADHRVRRPLAEVVRLGPDGVPYQVPEVALLFKARNDREKDRRDLAETWPRLDGGARAWLAEEVARSLGRDHPWLARFAALDGRRVQARD